MTNDYSEKFIFWAEWFQKEANMSRSFYVFYFPADNTVEIYDHRTKRTFLKRTKVEGISEHNFYIGAKLTIFGRQIVIMDYADTTTKNKLANKRERTFCLLKPDAIHVMDKIITTLEMENFNINQCLMVQMNVDQAIRFYADKQGEAILPMLMDYISSGPVLAMELIAFNAQRKLLEIAGPENPDDAKRDAQNSLRAKFGNDLIQNAVHCSESPESANRELEFFFSSDKSEFGKCQPVLDNSSLGVIKPHAIKEGKVGKIISEIYDAGFKIPSMKMIFLERPYCEEFYEIYRSVVPEYVQMVLELSNGPCVAFEVVTKNSEKNTYSEFRKLCGPVDPELAKQLRPHTIRAKFGVDKIRNAIHCTDLEEDTKTEIQYFFKIV